jgi:PAS domain S-box-containing protein
MPTANLIELRRLLANSDSAKTFGISEARDEVIRAYNSPRWKRLLGYDDHEIGSDLDAWLSCIHPDDVACVVQSRLDYLNRRSSRNAAEYRLRCKDGSYCWVLERIQASWNTAGEVVRITSSLKDISRRKQQFGAVAGQRSERGQGLHRVVQSIRQSLDRATVFSTATREIAQLLLVDRVMIAEYCPNQPLWRIVADYHHHPDLPNVLGLELPDHTNAITARLKQFKGVRIRNASAYEAEPLAGFAQFSPGSWLLLPLQFDGHLWGGITLMNSRCLPWQAAAVEVAREVVDQLAIAIQQCQLHQEVQRLNAELAAQIQSCTAQLQLAFDREATLKQITDKVRDSLDEQQILQSAVKELTLGLGILGCNAALFDLSQGTSCISYEYTQLDVPMQRRVSRMSDFPELYSPLLQGQHFQFCSLLPNPVRGRVAVFCCPILGNQQVLGGLWLINHSDHSFSEQDIRLVQQVANQCAIALRQSRLYQAAQAQVVELERLNRLKDDFLSTVSHELRTPMSSIKMAIELLDLVLLHDEQGQSRDQPDAPVVLSAETFQKIKRYFRFLSDGCQQEITLINDLLDLTRIDADAEPLNLLPLDLPSFLAAIVRPFVERMQRQQQTLIVDLPPDLPLLDTEPAYLQRILTELLNNAYKYTPSGEMIALAVRLEQQAPLTQSFQPHARFLTLTVTNSGVEIPASEQARVFERFYRIPNNDPWKHSGTGLGLALVKKLVDRLGGTIELQSSDQMTQFVIHLPLS